MPQLAGRIYVPKLYKITPDRWQVVSLLEGAVGECGGRVIYSSFRHERVAPVYLGAEDGDGRRYGMLIYPFTATKRDIRNRPPDEHRAQIRFGDPVRERDEDNRIGRDVAGVDVTLVLTVDPEQGMIVGLDPLIYEDLPMGISVYYKDRHFDAVFSGGEGWAVWERTKSGGTRRESWAGLETLVGFAPDRLLDYARFEAKATGLGLDPGLRAKLAEEHRPRSGEQHNLEELFGVAAGTILDIVESNFRLGIAVRGGVAEHHLSVQLAEDPAVVRAIPIDEDGQPDYKVELTDGREVLLECKTASQNAYADGDYKIEVQKTRDSGAGRKYTYDQFDAVAACLFPVTGLWEFRFRWTADLEPWTEDNTRIRAIQRINSKWSTSLAELIQTDPATSSP